MNDGTDTLSSVEFAQFADETFELIENAPPVAGDDSSATLKNFARVIDVLANDTDADGTLDKTTVTIVDGPEHGTVSVNPTTGKITYTPTADYVGTDSFTYTVKDDDGTVSNEATVSLNVQYPYTLTEGEDVFSGDSLGWSGGGIAVNGLGGDDYIVTSNSKSQPDTVNGGDGNDLIFTGGGDDYVDGGDGNDVIHARGGTDTVIGGTGDDTYVFRFFGNKSSAATDTGTTTITDTDGVLWNGTFRPASFPVSWTPVPGATAGFAIGGTASYVSAGVWDLAVTDDNGATKNLTLNYTGDDLTITGGTLNVVIQDYVNGTFGITLDGTPGNDILPGGAGALHGGFGLDVVTYSGNASSYTVERSGLITTVTGPDGTDTLTSVELIQFADQTMPLPPARSDFYLDGASDLLFRNNDTGDLGYYRMNTDGTLEGWHSIGGSSAAYSAAGIGDFNGDDIADILWRNEADGDTGYYQMNGDGTFGGWHWIGGSSTAYDIVGVGDFNGDDISDILWRNNADGDTGYYQMNGDGTLEGWHSIGGSSPAYNVVGVGDFNGDAVSDILWRDNSTGDTGYFQMNSGGTLEGWHSIGGSSTAYNVVGVGDFNGDGISDILWRNNADGDLGFHQMNNDGTLEGWHAIGGSSTDYMVEGTGDYNNDGTSDILFRNAATGDTGYYEMNAGEMVAWHPISGSSPTYDLIV
jgi:hypothetical protein